jgi:DNA-binding transcriptional MocR family regulator
MSFMTVGHAYQMLESQGRIVARPQSGYYVASRPTTQQPAPPAQVMRDEVVDINTYIFDVFRPAAIRLSFLLLPRFPIPGFSRFSSSTARWLTSAKPRPR